MTGELEAVRHDPAIGISYSVAIGEGRQITFQAHVARDEDQAVLNGMVDKLYVSTERLVNRCAAASLSFVMEKLTDDYEDQTRVYNKSVEQAAANEQSLEALMGDERAVRRDPKAKNALSAKIIASRAEHSTYATNLEAYTNTMNQLAAKRAAHLEKAK